MVGNLFLWGIIFYCLPENKKNEKKMKKNNFFQKKDKKGVDTFLQGVYIHIHRRTALLSDGKRKLFDNTGKERKTK